MDANGIKTQLFQKIRPKFLNRSVVDPSPWDPSLVLAAGGKPSTWFPPGRLAAGGRPSTWPPPGRPRGSRKKHTFMLLLPKVIRGWGPLDPERLKTYSEILGRFFEKVEFFWH